MDQSRRADWWNIVNLALLPQGWLIVGFVAMAPAVVAGSESSGRLATEVGTILLGYTALRGMASALSMLTGAAIALERSKDFFVAADNQIVSTLFLILSNRRLDLCAVLFTPLLPLLH